MDKPLQPRLADTLKIADSLEATKWEERYLVLEMEQRRLYFFSDSDSVNLVPQSPSKPYSQDDFSLPVRAQTDADAAFKRGTTLGRVSSFNKLRTSFRRQKREKDEKVDKVKYNKAEKPRTYGRTNSDKPVNTLTQGKRLGQSLDSLDKLEDLPHAALGEHNTWMDMATGGTLCIQEVHASISPKHSCFRIITSTHALYASCGSSEDLQKWLKHLNACRQPQKELHNRVDTRLVVSVQEARHLTAKKWYFCDIYLNGILYSQTCCKQKSDILFWGEQFVFGNLPPITQITLHVYKESQTKKKKDKSGIVELASVDLPMHQLVGGGEHEKWYNLNVNPNAQSKGLINPRDQPAIRIKASYQTVSVLPLKAYKEFQEYLSREYSHVVRVLEPVVSAKWKDEIAQTLLRILQVTGQVKEFLVDVVHSEVQHTDNENLVFRGNTFATKAVDTYMKLVGVKYLRETLCSPVLNILDSEGDSEVDSTKLPSNGNLDVNKKNLEKQVTETWAAILNSAPMFPSDLKQTFYAIRKKFGPAKEDVCFRLISGSIFLRFFCPAILSPSLFHLCQEYPDDKTNRKLTLVAKVIQSLANFTRFGVKEEYMYFMNGFVDNEIPQMRRFLDEISSPPKNTVLVRTASWEPYQIDLGREISIMHTILTDQMKKLGEPVSSKLPRLVDELENVTKTKEESGKDLLDNAMQHLSSTRRQFDSPSPPEMSTPTSPPDSLRSPVWYETVGEQSYGTVRRGIQKFESVAGDMVTKQTPPRYFISSGQLNPGKVDGSRYRSSVPNLHSPLSPGHSPGRRLQRPRATQSQSMDYGQPPNAVDDFEEMKKVLKAEQERNQKFMKEIESLKGELGRSEEANKQLISEVNTLQRNKGEKLQGVLGVLDKAENTYKDEKGVPPEYENIKRKCSLMEETLKQKDETIDQMRCRISALKQANETLSKGLEQLQKLSSDYSDSDSEDDLAPLQRSEPRPPPARISIDNGRPNGGSYYKAKDPVTPTTKEFLKVVSRLDKGQFNIHS